MSDDIEMVETDGPEVEAPGPVTFEGTPCEVSDWVHTHFMIMRRFVEGAMDGVEGEELEKFEDMLDALDRSVYRVTIEPLGMVAKQRVRPERAMRVMRMETAYDLFDMFAKSEEQEDDSVLSSETVQ